MNYFRCTVGGSGKGNTVTVTCAEEFAGLTITLSKTGKTYTKTCPSTAPYVVTFNGVENGTYTVSCTVDGQTYSETVIVQDISCVLNYGFKWQTWVDTASQLDSSDYDTLDEVLADEKALRELFLEHACVDYMASATATNADLETVINNDYCAKWINLSDYALDYLYANEVIADLMDEADKYFYGEWVITDSTTTPATWGPKGNVPVMTSNTAPYGEAFSTNYYSSELPWKAFNGLATDQCSANNNSLPWAIGYKSTNPICVRKFMVVHRTDNKHNTAFKLQGSNDGTNYTDLGEYTNTSDKVQILTVPNNTTYYLYHRINVTAIDGTGAGFAEIQFYGRELSVSVPTMTSNTSPYGEAAGSTQYQSYYPYYVFDGNTSTRWVATSSTNSHITYDFGKEVKIEKVMVHSYYESSKLNLKNFKIQTCDTANGTYTDEGTGQTTNADTDQYFDITPTHTGRYWRLYGIDTWGTNYITLFTLQFWGKDYSEKEFETGSSKKWLYDHGVELETITAYSQNASFADDLEKTTECLKNKGTHTGNYVLGFLSDVFDLTNYSLLRASVGNVLVTRCQMQARKDATPVYGESQRVISYVTATPPITSPYNVLAVDISSADQNGACGVCQTADGSKYEITEMWLE